MVGTICASSAAIVKAGENVGAVPAESWDNFIEEAEAYVCATTRFDWVTAWPTASGACGAKIVEEAVCDLAAIYGIEYDMFGYSSLDEAQAMIDVLYTRTQDCIELIKDQEVKDFII